MNNILLIIFLCSLTFIAGCSEFDFNPRMFNSAVNYRLEIHASDSITNATFYLPLPVKNGVPMIGPLLLNREQFEQDNFSVHFVQSPPELSFRDDYPLQNDHAWFLKISAPQIDSNNSNKAVYTINIGNISMADSPNIINTKMPFGNESVFLPKMDFSLYVPEKKLSRSKYWIEYVQMDDTQTIPVFAEYSAAPVTKVHISASISGSNSWLEHYDSSIGNSYWDVFDWSNYGESQGWYKADGEMRSARGIYPNMDEPAWQKFMNQTAMK